MFNLATNFVSRFIIGWPDQKNNFFLQGILDEKGEPLISCRIFNKNGNFIFELDKNKLIKGSSDYWQKRIGFLSGPGWEIKDEYGSTVLETETINGMTYIIGVFYDNKGNIVVEGDKVRGLNVSCPLTLR